MRWQEPDTLAVVRPTGVCLLYFFCSGFQFYVLLSPYLCFISFFYFLIYMFWETMHGYIRGSSCKPNIFVSWSTSELRVRLARPENWSKPYSKIFWLTVPRRYFFYGLSVLFISCVCHAFASVHCSLRSPAEKGLTSWLLFVTFIVILLFSHLVYKVRCDA